MTILYPDVSNVNWTDTAEWTAEGQKNLLDFLGALHGEGFHGLVHKVGQGADFQDPYWITCRTWCETNDTSWLGYHYCNTDDPNQQARNFVTNSGGPNVMLDFELQSGGIDNFWALVNAFNDAGVNVSLAYLPHWYWGDIGEPDLSALAPSQIALVSSAYPGGVGSATDIYNWCGGDGGPGWSTYGGCAPTVWQYTSNASIAGFNVDCNAFKGENLDVLFTS